MVSAELALKLQRHMVTWSAAAPIRSDWLTGLHPDRGRGDTGQPGAGVDVDKADRRRGVLCQRSTSDRCRLRSVRSSDTPILSLVRRTTASKTDQARRWAYDEESPQCSRIEPPGDLGTERGRNISESWIRLKAPSGCDAFAHAEIPRVVAIRRAASGEVLPDLAEQNDRCHARDDQSSSDTGSPRLFEHDRRGVLIFARAPAADSAEQNAVDQIAR